MTPHIALIGGTHGNESSGIQIIRNYRRLGLPDAAQGLNVSLHLANPAAINANVRYVEDDLNRQFTPARLRSNDASQEAVLARHLNETLGPKGHSDVDLVIDIHNTTSNMGATLILLDDDAFNVQLARYVKQQMPQANILLEDEKPYNEHAYLCTLGKRGVMVEVGAQPQGVLREDILLQAQTMTEIILAFCAMSDKPDLPPCSAFRLGENVMYPLDDFGLRSAMIHHELQDRDFLPLMPGQPVFRSFDGKDITWWEDTPTYPHFINEAAYHKLDVAFASASQITL
ncbi:aspartoacylase [Alteromonas halophila]|uniref:Aspartoacylase n=1 Tax=Alteromonas halophila TaxID=516698 RepID=A0A918JQ98_9ALTE|nr:aspartoacylase [Alteromonas halophila]GGW94080.1 putative aspartoacylase [Alteromonas halophila]